MTDTDLSIPSLHYRGRSVESAHHASSLKESLITRETDDSAHIDVDSGPDENTSRATGDSQREGQRAITMLQAAERQALIAKAIADFLNIITDVALTCEFFKDNRKMRWQAWAAVGCTCVAILGFMCLLAIVCRISNRCVDDVKSVEKGALILSSIADTGVLVVGVAGGLKTIELKDIPLMTSTAASLIAIVGRFIPYMC